MNLDFNNNQIYSQIKPLFAYLQKQRENQKFLQSLEIGATFFLISFFAFFAIKPTLTTISSLVGDIKAKELLKTELKGKINNVITAQDLFSQVQEKYALVESSLPNNPAFFQAALQINSNLINNQISPGKINFAVNDNKTFSANISTSAAFPIALSLLDNLSQNRRLISFNNLVFSVGKNEDQSQKINLLLPLTFYYWPTYEQK